MKYENNKSIHGYMYFCKMSVPKWLSACSFSMHILASYMAMVDNACVGSYIISHVYVYS